MSLITAAFERLKHEKRKGFIPFITAGDPDLQTTAALAIELAKSGVTAIELGIPFSDPVADGPVIQRASERALKHRFGIEDVINLIVGIRKQINTPIVLFSYFNPLLQFGLDRLSRLASAAGVDGILVTDLIPEEGANFLSMCRSCELDNILLAAPSTSDQRLRLIAQEARGFIYAVSSFGVTGARAEIGAEAKRLVQRLRRQSNLPVAVGFGISSAEQVAETWAYADAAVVGSAIVAEIERLAGASDLVYRIGDFTRRLQPDDSTAE